MYKTYWDILIAVLVIYSIIVEPLKLSFSPHDHYHSLDEFEWVITFLFIIDIFLSFITGYEDKQTDIIIYDVTLIRNNYLKFWFWIDLVSTIPYDSILTLFKFSEKHFSVIRIIRIIRLIRLFKLYNLVGIDELLDNLKINPAIVSLSLLVLQMMFFAHLLACLWHGIGTPNFLHTKTWVTEYDYDIKTGKERYVASLYYIIVTMLTIGFGEIHPINTTERLFATLLMFTGGITFGSLINKLTTFLNQRNPQAKAYKLHMNELKSYLMDFKFPKELSNRVKVGVYLTLISIEMLYDHQYYHLISNIIIRISSVYITINIIIMIIFTIINIIIFVYDCYSRYFFQIYIYVNTSITNNYNI